MQIHMCIQFAKVEIEYPLKASQFSCRNFNWASTIEV